MIEIRHHNITNQALEKCAYNEIYQDKGIQQLDSFYLWLIELLNPQSNQTLLDISCGQGDLVRFALKRKMRAVGLDFAEAALQLASRNTTGSFSLADAHILPFGCNSFDFVTNIGSIEHYFDPPQSIREISRVLKPSGIACILLPNTYALLGNIKHVWQTGDVFDDGQPLQRYNTLNGWHHLLVENGLIPFRTVKYEIVRPRTFANLMWYLARPMKIAHLMLNPFIPLALGNCFVYLCRPNQDFKSTERFPK